MLKPNVITELDNLYNYMDEYILTVILVSSSGVLSPGPLFFANIIHARSYGYKGALSISTGHAIVELVLVLLISSTLINIEAIASMGWTISILGGSALLAFVSVQVSGVLRRSRDNVNNIRLGRVSGLYMLVLIGIIFSVFNPFFIAWWLTVGMKLIYNAMEYDGYGLAVMFIVHIWMDYAWLTLTALLAGRGISMIDHRYYRFLILMISAILVYIAVQFLIEGVNYLL